MQDFLQQLVVSNIFAFILIFVRFGVAMMIMPGIGDSFVSPQVRLLFAVAISFVLTPVLSSHLPTLPPGSFALLSMIVSEAFIGVFIGTVMRILVSALDTAGTLVSIQSSLSNSTMFNPTTEAQVPILSAVYSSLGVTLIFVTGMDHQMLAAVVDSYKLFPATAGFPDTGSVSETIVKTLVLAFKVGVQLAVPFLVVGTLVQVGFGLLGRLMPQVQVFLIALPLQILLSSILLVFVLSAVMAAWLKEFEAAMVYFLSGGG